MCLLNRASQVMRTVRSRWASTLLSAFPLVIINYWIALPRYRAKRAFIHVKSHLPNITPVNQVINQSTLLFEYSVYLVQKPTGQKIIRLSLVCTQTFFPFFMDNHYEGMKTTTSAWASAQLIPRGFIFTSLLKGLGKNKRSVQQTKLSFTVRCTLAKMPNFNLNSNSVLKNALWYKRVLGFISILIIFFQVTFVLFF